MREHRKSRARAVAVMVTLAGVVACGTAAPERQSLTTTPTDTASAGTPATPAGGAAIPAPDEPVPETAAALASALRRTTGALNDAIDAWGKDGKPPADVELLALYQQRIYRYAARHPKVASRAFARLPAPLAAQAKDNTAAIRELLALAHPIKPDAVFKVQRPRPAAELLGHFKRAERRFGVEWEVLAAVMFAETKFGRVRSDSHVGAQGPMQFMPATWKAYGMGGDVQDPRDAVMAAANYLKATGAPRDYQRALHAYNPSQAYVDAILLHARQIKRDARNYYVYYNWQVFVLTTAGERRLTGPR
ncbi:lytic transglycosylase domain-containing protein [Nonomuraea sp. K274]|uniref:Lytic transglycosylase domain-containing protein n=1 Tax=Nonomuraea cypriaca TaxID=1187855 RepID=A0A931AHT2_9ACTN|nr:lytic transglycosylase domain-containing protein [Nonomuraea cypriaca]MBF8193111.1 lytic transglycosylase domain-containing protein [Nonomuraea cypriaca]